MTWYIDAYNNAKANAKQMKKEIQEEISGLNEKVKVMHQAMFIMESCGTKDDNSHCQLRLTLNSLESQIEKLENEIKRIESDMKDAYKAKVNCEESAGEQLAVEAYWRAMEDGDLYCLATGKIQCRAWARMINKLEKRHGAMQSKAQEQKLKIIEAQTWK